MITEQRAALGDAFIKVYTGVHLWVCAYFNVYCVWVYFFFFFFGSVDSFFSSLLLFIYDRETTKA